METRLKRFLFKVTLSGFGKTPEEAWEDAVDSFISDPGVTPDKLDTEETNEEI